jgi:hypothetical protein
MVASRIAFSIFVRQMVVVDINANFYILAHSNIYQALIKEQSSEFIYTRHEVGNGSIFATGENAQTS